MSGSGGVRLCVNEGEGGVSELVSFLCPFSRITDAF
jgi:hypothetical protein